MVKALAHLQLSIGLQASRHCLRRDTQTSRCSRIEQKASCSSARQRDVFELPPPSMQQEGHTSLQPVLSGLPALLESPSLKLAYREPKRYGTLSRKLRNTCFPRRGAIQPSGMMYRNPCQVWSLYLTRVAAKCMPPLDPLLGEATGSWMLLVEQTSGKPAAKKPQP